MQTKPILATLLSATILANAAHAGGMSDPIMSPVVIEDHASSSSRAGILVPILAILLIGLAASNSGGGGAGPQVSDARLKTDITRVGTAPSGLPLYHFRYIGQMQMYEGVMAQDVLAYRPDAIRPLAGGYMAVDYKMLGLRMKQVAWHP